MVKKTSTTLLSCHLQPQPRRHCTRSAKATCLPQNASCLHAPREAKPRPKAGTGLRALCALLGSPGGSQHRAGLRETSTKLKINAPRGRAGGSPRARDAPQGIVLVPCKPRLVPTCEQSQQPEGHREQPEPRAHISHISVPRAGKHPPFASAETAAAPTALAPVPKNGRAAALCTAPFLLM